MLCVMGGGGLCVCVCVCDGLGWKLMLCYYVRLEQQAFSNYIIA